MQLKSKSTLLEDSIPIGSRRYNHNTVEKNDQMHCNEVKVGAHKIHIPTRYKIQIDLYPFKKTRKDSICVLEAISGNLGGNIVKFRTTNGSVHTYR